MSNREDGAWHLVQSIAQSRRKNDKDQVLSFVTKLLKKQKSANSKIVKNSNNTVDKGWVYGLTSNPNEFSFQTIMHNITQSDYWLYKDRFADFYNVRYLIHYIVINLRY